MEDFCHGSKAIKLFVYSVKPLPVKMDRAVFICDVCVCVCVCGVVIEIFAVASFRIYPATQSVFVFLPSLCCKKRDRDLVSCGLEREAIRTVSSIAESRVRA